MANLDESEFIANNYDKLEKEGKLQDEVNNLKAKSKAFFKNYNKSIDEKIFVHII